MTSPRYPPSLKITRLDSTPRFKTHFLVSFTTVLGFVLTRAASSVDDYVPNQRFIVLAELRSYRARLFVSQQMLAYSSNGVVRDAIFAIGLGRGQETEEQEEQDNAIAANLNRPPSHKICPWLSRKSETGLTRNCRASTALPQRRARFHSHRTSARCFASGRVRERLTVCSLLVLKKTPEHTGVQTAVERMSKWFPSNTIPEHRAGPVRMRGRILTCVKAASSKKSLATLLWKHSAVNPSHQNNSCAAVISRSQNHLRWNYTIGTSLISTQPSISGACVSILPANSHTSFDSPSKSRTTSQSASCVSGAMRDCSFIKLVRRRAAVRCCTLLAL